MKLRVKLFAAAKQLAGSDSVLVEVAEPTTVAALRTAMVQQFPALADLLRHALFAVNTEYVGSQTVLEPNAEVACIPPVSGG